MISRTAEYALRAMVWLAHTERRITTARHAADATLVPTGYLSKVLQKLVEAGLVTSQRGLRGGFRLARTPDQITVLDVVNAVDPIQRIHSCPLGYNSPSPDLCPLHRHVDGALQLIETAFAKCTLANLSLPTSVHPALTPAALPLCQTNGDTRRPRNGRRPRKRSH